MREIRQVTKQVVEKTRARFQGGEGKGLSGLRCRLRRAAARKATSRRRSRRPQEPGVAVRVYKNVASRALSEDEIRTLIEKRLLRAAGGFPQQEGQRLHQRLLCFR
ncbi:MAG: hypothetical protein R3F13_19510 [Prosthecobacter sp.]